MGCHSGTAEAGSAADGVQQVHPVPALQPGEEVGAAGVGFLVRAFIQFVNNQFRNKLYIVKTYNLYTCYRLAGVLISICVFLNRRPKFSRVAGVSFTHFQLPTFWYAFGAPFPTFTIFHAPTMRNFKLSSFFASLRRAI